MIVLDRQAAERRLAALALARDRAGRALGWGPVLWWRPWLLAAGIAFGAAAAVKWSGAWFLAAFGLYTVLADLLARRRAGIHLWGTSAILGQGPINFLWLVPVAVLTYGASWAGWFASEDGYQRHWAENAHEWTGPFAWVPLPVQSLIHYHDMAYGFHVGLITPHSYEANPFTWLLLIRPTSFWYEGSEAGDPGCGAAHCGAEILDLPNPLIWWAGTAAVVYLLVRLIRRREGRDGLILMGMLAGYIPWLAYAHRTVFQFYTIAFEPYMILAIVIAIGDLLGTRGQERRRRRNAIGVVIAFLLLVVLVSIYYWPVWVGSTIDYGYLASHWWLPTWR